MVMGTKLKPVLVIVLCWVYAVVYFLSSTTISMTKMTTNGVADNENWFVVSFLSSTISITKTTKNKTTTEGKIEEITAPTKALSDSDKFLPLLTVPFYVYTDPELWWLNNNLTVGGVRFQRWEDVPNLPVKHADDYFFAKAAFRHPLRVLDPSLAKLFVIPTLLNLLAEDENWLFLGVCVGAFYQDTRTTKQRQRVCGRRPLLRMINDTLSRSPWFQRNNGRDHLFVQSHYKSWKFVKGAESTALRRCHAIHFENQKCNDEDRFSFPSYYAGTNLCHNATPTTADHKMNNASERNVTITMEEEPEKNHGVVFVASMKARRTFRPRFLACSYLLEKNVTSKLLRIERCGEGPICPALATAQLGLHIRGDTLGSARLVETIVTGTVPVFTDEGQYEILPKWIDWDAISYFASIVLLGKDRFASHLEEILHDQDLYQQKLAMVRRMKPLFDWTTLVPFDTYMFMLQCNLWPAECNTNRPAFTQYSLVLRPPRFISSTHPINNTFKG